MSGRTYAVKAVATDGGTRHYDRFADALRFLRGARFSYTVSRCVNGEHTTIIIYDPSYGIKVLAPNGQEFQIP